VVVVLDAGLLRPNLSVPADRKGPEWFGDVLTHSPRWKRGGSSRRRRELNRFGRFALQSWQTLAPAALAQITDPSRHFSELGEEAESQWASLWPQLLTPDSPGENLFSKAGRIEAAKMQAEEMIRAELLTPPEELQEPDEGDDPGPLGDVMQAWRSVLDEDS
jgi:hypothetical protein